MSSGTPALRRRSLSVVHSCGRYRSYAGAADRRFVLPLRFYLPTRCIGETLMEARTVNNLPPAATHDDTVRCLLAIELSKKSWIVAVNTPLSDKISRHTLKAGDGKELLDLCERIRTRVARETKQRVEIVSCYEAGYDGFWLHRLLEAHSIRNYVIDPASLQVDRRARPAKTDRVEGGRLFLSLMAYLRGEPKVWRCVQRRLACSVG